MDTRGCRCKSRLFEAALFDLLTLTRNHREKTIEGDLFGAFVAAGAISKANADDPKKSSLIRCARTDKGVHAAGNLISLKLIIEDPDIVQKINEKLSPQIRVFGIERTNGAFNAYQFVDSRIYEYLIPTHVFLPPHPSSFLGKKLVELAEEADDLEGYRNRQRDEATFWEATEAQYIKPVLEQLDPSIRSTVFNAFYEPDANHFHVDRSINSLDQAGSATQIFRHAKLDSGAGPDELATDSANQRPSGSEAEDPDQQSINAEAVDPAQHSANVKEEDVTQEQRETSDQLQDPSPKPTDQSSIDFAIKKLRAECIAAKNGYRINPDRLARVRSTLSMFLGSQNYHNYTVNKDFRDSSAKRVIKSFVVHGQPLLINGTEWLSLKVHGQSFMMHQIRKMVSMVALVVRCGCHEGRIQDSYMKEKMSIPKAPGLGLLLERPVFDTYNEKLVGQFGREKIDFGKFEEVIEEFKQKEIYERIFREEEHDNQSVPLSAPFFRLLALKFFHTASFPSPITKANPAIFATKQKDSTPSSPASTTSNPRNSFTFLPLVPQPHGGPCPPPRPRNRSWCKATPSMVHRRTRKSSMERMANFFCWGVTGRDRASHSHSMLHLPARIHQPSVSHT